MQKAARGKYGDVFGLLMDMGTGKSKVIVDEFGERYAAGEVSDLLLFAPAGCYRNWFDDSSPHNPSEFRKHLDPAVYDKLITVPWISGGGVGYKNRLRSMIESRSNRPRAFIVNIEAMGRVDAVMEACREFIETSRKGVIMTVDESTTIKNMSAGRTSDLLRLAEPGPKLAAKRIMTGLVAPNSPLDIFSQFLFLNWRILGFQSFVGFRSRYAYVRRTAMEYQTKTGKIATAHVPIITGYKNIDELHALIEPWSYRVLKEDCLDLPEKQYMFRDVELTKEQARIYREVKEYATAELAAEQWVTATMVITRRIRLDQILCGFTKDEEGNTHYIPENRTKALLELLADFQGKAIIWTTHDECIRKIGDALTKEYGPGSVAQFWGGNAKTRGADEARFKGDPKCRFMVATQGAGGRGNTWVGAGLSVYYNNNDNLEHRAQSEDRNHRDGLMGKDGAKSALYVDLRARGTIDENKIQNLRNKIDLSTQVTGENYREWLV